jgi:hypothetical protein
MRICYVDEAGCTGALPSAGSDIQPVFVLCGVAFQESQLTDLTHEFLALKRRFFPNLPVASSHYLTWILTEIKGSDLRKQAVSPSRRHSRHALGFLDETVKLLERFDARIFGRVWVKGIGIPFNGRSVYTYSLQYICQWFDHCLGLEEDRGMVVCDSRNKALNTIASHSVFTQKFRAPGDLYPRICEMPTFGHSENHAGVQIADLLCSALLFPLAVDAYCRPFLTGVHTRPYGVLRDRFAERLEARQVRCTDPRHGRISGGIVVDDKLGRRPRSLMFAGPPASRNVQHFGPMSVSITEGTHEDATLR